MALSRRRTNFDNSHGAFRLLTVPGQIIGLFDRTRDGKKVGVARPDEKKKMGKKVVGERMRRKEWKESRR